MKRLLSMAFALALGLTLLLVASAFAHAFPDHCTPEVGSTLKQAPSELRCTYTDPIDAKQTVIAVFDAKNNQVDNKDLKSDPNDKDGKTVFVTLNTAKIANGLYTVKWKTVAQDGDTTDGQWQFAVGTESVPSVSIVSPSMDKKFDKDPADVVVTIKANNFQLGQGGRRWQVSLDEKVMSQITDATTTYTLKAVPKGDHRLDIALVTDDKTVVATAGMHLGIGADDQMNATPAPSSPSQPAVATGGSNPLGLYLVVSIGAIVLIGAIFLLARRRPG